MGNIADALEKAGVELVDKQHESIEDTGPATEVEESIPVQPSLEKNSSTRDSRPETKIISVDPPSSDSWDERIDLVANRSSIALEAFRVLRSAILYPQDGMKSPKTIVIASSAPEEGKSFVSINLAIAIARGLDQYALLVDCDLRRPSLAGLLGMKDICAQGLAEYLREECELPDVIQRTSVDKLSLLGSGSVPANPAELLSSERMGRLVSELSDRYADRLIIFDSPPFQLASESVVLTKNVDGVVIVVGSGKSDRSKIKTMVESIGQEKVIGVVFNGHKEGYLKSKMFDPYGGYGHYYRKNDVEG